MTDIIVNIPYAQLDKIGPQITEGVSRIIDNTKHTVAVYLNSEVSMTYWHIGKYIADELDAVGNEKFDAKIVATVSRQLSVRYGKGHMRASIFRMLKVARKFRFESGAPSAIGS